MIKFLKSCKLLLFINIAVVSLGISNISINQLRPTTAMLDINVIDLSTVKKPHAKKPENIQTVKKYVEEKPYEKMIKKIAIEYGLDPYIVLSIAYQESNLNPDAINYNGTCVGIMQIYASVHAQRIASMGISDIFDPESNVRVGCSILSDYLKYNGNNLDLALMLYSGSHDYAFSMHEQGLITLYVQEVKDRSEVLKGGN